MSPHLRNVLLFGGLIAGLAAMQAALTPLRAAESAARNAAAVEGAQMFSAILVSPDDLAKHKAVTVEVKVDGIELVDPAEAGSRSKPGQAHLHYQVDQGPVIVTTATKLSFQDLASGDHTITVNLAGNDHRPVGPQQVLSVRIP